MPYGTLDPNEFIKWIHHSMKVAKHIQQKLDTNDSKNQTARKAAKDYHAELSKALTELMYHNEFRSSLAK